MRPQVRSASPSLLVERRNCWRRARARRVAFLIDGEAYFAAVAAAAARARESILIVGWDVHGDVRLVRDGTRPALPDRLGAFLNALVARRPTLNVWVLDWDFAMIYTFERQPFPLFELGWRTHRRVHFALDGNHPPGASQHQKIVVVDDRVAFVGGFDLAACRWDTRAHAADDPRRVDPGFGSYAPFHDVQVAVSGEAAAALGTLVRDRWRRATGRRIAVPRRGADAWPPGLAPVLEDVDVGIARTEPAWDGRAAVHEVERLHLDAIAAARQTIYLESQYLTSARVGDALAARLGETSGPEVVVVTPRTCAGWLEETTMGVLRARLLARLRAADRHGRLHVYAPVVPAAAGTDVDVNVHSKVLVVDDRLLRIGSSNVSNRSMRLDTECDLAIEAHDAQVARAIQALRDDLVAEHLGVAPGRVTDAVRRTGSLAGAIEGLRTGPRTLRPLTPEVPPWTAALVPESRLVDPEAPVEVEDLMRAVLPGRLSRVTGRAVFYALGTTLAVGATAVCWRRTRLGPAAEALAARARALDRRAPARAALATTAAYVAGGAVFLPLNAALFVTGLIFPTGRGFIYGLMGAMTSALALHATGRFLPRDAVRLLAGPRLNRARRQLGRGVLAAARGRLLPAAPFTAVNLVAGAARVPLRDFALGSLVALAPGSLAAVVLGRHFALALHRRDARAALALAAATAAVPLVQATMTALLDRRPRPRTFRSAGA